MMSNASACERLLSLLLVMGRLAGTSKNVSLKN
jgi:hypothetical protein